ncbi:hypothetical protein KIH27_03365 [Mycobacterium sp. M1]|uniref:Lipoprotein n=1 Tax=Mycolicibacter acidiphilus TaxID=2835306 RepID=A0ABS5REB0_9MYCO|nr:hypothetical protein [Mycolicibacter acidiphilus]MBS9532622.1 hypothetical protein [Mycolicibacter acidiphilus]
MLLTAGVVVGCAHGGTKTVEGKATAASESASASSTVPPDQVVHQWDTRTLPCANPDYTEGPPVNRFGIVPDGTYPYADDIRAQLQDLTAVGSPEFVAGRIQHLNVILVLTESDMTIEDRDGSRNVDRANKDKTLEAQAVRQAQQMLSVQKSQYDNAVKNTLDQLRNGPDFQVPADSFTDSKMCH